MIHSVFITFLLLTNFYSYGQVPTLDRHNRFPVSDSNIHLNSTPNADWNALYLSTLTRSPSRALNMLQTRYTSLNYYGDKLYLSSLLYEYMSHRPQPFYGVLQTTVNIKQ